MLLFTHFFLASAQTVKIFPSSAFKFFWPLMLILTNKFHFSSNIVRCRKWSNYLLLDFLNEQIIFTDVAGYEWHNSWNSDLCIWKSEQEEIAVIFVSTRNVTWWKSELCDKLNCSEHRTEWNSVDWRRKRRKTTFLYFQSEEVETRDGWGGRRWEGWWKERRCERVQRLSQKRLHQRGQVDLRHWHHIVIDWC